MAHRPAWAAVSVQRGKDKAQQESCSHDCSKSLPQGPSVELGVETGLCGGLEGNSKLRGKNFLVVPTPKPVLYPKLIKSEVHNPGEISLSEPYMGDNKDRPACEVAMWVGVNE